MSHFYGFVNIAGRRIPQWQVTVGYFSSLYVLYKVFSARSAAKPIPAPVYNHEEKAFIEEYIRAVNQESRKPAFIRSL